MADNKRRLTIDGTTHVFPADFTDDDIATALGGATAPAPVKPEATAAGNMFMRGHVINDGPTPQPEPDTWIGGAWKGLNDYASEVGDAMFQSSAHPETKGDFAGLLLPNAVATSTGMRSLEGWTSAVRNQAKAGMAAMREAKPGAMSKPAGFIRGMVTDAFDNPAAANAKFRGELRPAAAPPAQTVRSGQPDLVDKYLHEAEPPSQATDTARWDPERPAPPPTATDTAHWNPERPTLGSSTPPPAQGFTAAERAQMTRQGLSEQAIAKLEQQQFGASASHPATPAVETSAPPPEAMRDRLQSPETNDLYHGSPVAFDEFGEPGVHDRNSRGYPFRNATHFGETAEHAKAYGPHVTTARVKGHVLDILKDDVRASAQKLADASTGETAAYYRRVAAGQEKFIDFEVLAGDLSADPGLLKRAGFSAVRYSDEGAPAIAVFDRSNIVKPSPPPIRVDEATLPQSWRDLPHPLDPSRVDIGAEKAGRAAKDWRTDGRGLSKQEVRDMATPILDQLPGEASPILPEGALKKIVDAVRALPPGGPERIAYVARATSGKAQWQIENIRRTLEHLGLIVPIAAAGASTLRDSVRQRLGGN